MLKTARSIALLALLAFGGCAAQPSVRQSDLDAWVGQPVTALDKHPIFLTTSFVRTRADDGTEIRNYVTGHPISSCTKRGDIDVVGGFLNSADYREFNNCMQSFAACNTAASLALPIPKGMPRMPARAPVAAPARMLDVTLSEGQATRAASSRYALLSPTAPARPGWRRWSGDQRRAVHRRPARHRRMERCSGRLCGLPCDVHRWKERSDRPRGR